MIYSALILYALSVILLLAKKEGIFKAATIVGLIMHTAVLVLRTVEVGHAPMANRYETLLFFSWSIILTNLIVVFRYRITATSLITSPIAIIILAFAMNSSDTVTPLFPALKTIWFEIHVTSSFAGYALFTLAMSAAVFFLMSGGIEDEAKYSEIGNKSVLWGFILFSLAMFSGAIWGYLAWGTYWMWEPKMLWSFILWFYYAGILHARYVKTWRGKPVAWLTIIGFGIVMFAYLGVSVLLKSSHKL